MIIAVDAGKFATKAYNGKDRFYIQTRFETTTEHQQGLKIFYNDNLYLIGEDAQENDLDTTKMKLLHKLTFYTSIFHLAENKDTLTLVLGCPLGLYTDVYYRTQYKGYMVDSKVLDIEVNSYKKRFFINDLLIFPETAGYIFEHYNECLNDVVAVIDLGGLNASGCIYTNLKPAKTSIFTINKGINIFLSELKRELNNRFNLNYQDYEMQFILKRGVFIEGIYNKEINQFIDNFKYNFIHNIITECKKYNWNIKGLKIVFTGGGTLILKDAILKLLPHAIISDNPIWDNVLGFYKAGVVYDNKY